MSAAPRFSLPVPVWPLQCHLMEELKQLETKCECQLEPGAASPVPHGSCLQHLPNVPSRVCQCCREWRMMDTDGTPCAGKCSASWRTCGQEKVRKPEERLGGGQ